VQHLALAVRDENRSRRFYETYFGFGARPARRYDGGVLMLYDAHGFALALGPAVTAAVRVPLPRDPEKSRIRLHVAATTLLP
jgi:catechol 2,3-dioxygenase-like lactoylglutathione lyase family enzyme